MPASLIKLEGYEAGTPDLTIFFYQAPPIMIEFKTPTGKLSPAQKEVEQNSPAGK